MSLKRETAWVVRSARRAARPAVSMAAVGRGGVDPDGVGYAPHHTSTVKRWEEAASDLTYWNVRRYEFLLGLPHGQLTCAVDHLARWRQPVRQQAVLRPPEARPVAETLELLEKALSTERMTGADWDLLTDDLGRMPHPLVRDRDWEAMLRRLVAECVVNLDVEYLLRDEAAARLAGHPRSGQIVARFVRSVIDDPGSQFFNDTLTLLQFTDEPQALGILAEQLREPANDHALRACLFALTTLARGRRLPPQYLRDVVPSALRLVRDTSLPYRVQRGAANVIRSVASDVGVQLATALSLEDQRAAASILLSGRAVDRDTLARMKRGVRAHMDAGVADTWDEPELQLLVDTALGSTDEHDRGMALSVLMLVPQGHWVGRAQAQQLREALAADDDVAALETLAVLSWLVQSEDAPLLVDLALDPTRPAALAAEAATVLGNITDRDAGQAVDADRRLALGIFTALRGIPDDTRRLGARTGATPDAVLRVHGFAYALGMRGRFDLMAGIRNSPLLTEHEYGAELAGILDYWLDLPEHIRPPAGEP
ncbi:hypothetical protein [Terracoccus luteus]|jgi:hypothetical protein|uniref:Uncharacterized protein n=1 Tax=Terracoccus luteus TaxID=53356 RepID=A0A839PSZ9_9MICO|nr:hypothetical protein [Terracoccus luteus]MBB2986647.1 hypothetical protein [Terracoccus luteus]MCP2171764.1 hypothetical protein [Terracoccus luteus]